MENLLFLIVLLIANVIQAITGFAGTVLAMPPSMLLLGMGDAKVVLNVMALLSGLMIAWTGRKYIQWKELCRMLAFMLVGMLIGIGICMLVKSNDVLLIVYGFLIVIIAIKNIIIKKQHDLPRYALVFILLLAGVVHGMYVSGGALLVIYAVQVLKEKNEFRSTVALIWVFLNSFIIVSQVVQGQFNENNIRLIIISILPLIFATWTGTKIAEHVSQKLFLYVTYILLLISGITLIVL